MSTVQEIKAAIYALSRAERAELERWLRGKRKATNAETIPVREAALDPEVDSPELEAELLKAAKGPFTPYARKDLEAVAERVLSEKRRQ